MLKQVFWIDSSKFVTDVVSATLREENITCYTHGSADNFHFILEDMRPEVLVVDASTLGENTQVFFKTLESGVESSKIPVVLLGNEEELQTLSKKYKSQIKGIIKKPLAPMALTNELKKILGLTN